MVYIDLDFQNSFGAQYLKKDVQTAIRVVLPMELYVFSNHCKDSHLQLCR